MKWGVRRYQNPDGTLTEKGRKRYYRNLASRDEYGDFEELPSLSETKKIAKKFGISAESNASIQQAKNDFDKERGLMTEASRKFVTKDWTEEHNNFNKLVKKVYPDLEGYELEYSAAQIYCINRGINPVDYAKKVKVAENNYNKALEKEVGKILGEIGDQHLPNRANDTVKSYTAKAIEHTTDYDYFDSDMLGLTWDREEFEDLCRVAKRK